jgi:hypothetical protein
MNRGMFPQQRLEIPGGDQVGKFNGLDVVARVQQRSSRCDIDSVMKIFFLLVAIPVPCPVPCPVLPGRMAFSSYPAVKRR